MHYAGSGLRERSLNRDYRYQLTAIGKPQPNLYIADKIASNTFRIAGGPPRHESVVAGDRNPHDAYAREHRIVPEVLKEPNKVSYRSWASSCDHGNRSTKRPAIALQVRAQ